MKILLFGGEGQLGREVRPRAHELNFDVIAPVMSEVDIANRDQVFFLMEQLRPDLVLNCAAYTAVDLAETERDLAFAVNHIGVENIALATRKHGGRVIHISTDYVFAGDGARALTESDPTKPINVYGESKLAGEVALAKTLGDRALTVRTSSLHGQYGQNFVHTMLKLFTERAEVSVVDDQWMSPTWAGWLAEVLVDLVRMDISGVVHASCAGTVSWHQFASEILSLTQDELSPRAIEKLVPIGAAAYPRPAKRPAYSVFDCARLTQILGREPISWKVGLRSHLQEVGYMCGSEAG